MNLVPFQAMYHVVPGLPSHKERIASILCDLASQENHDGDYWDVVQAAGEYIYYCENTLLGNYVSYIVEPKPTCKNPITKAIDTIPRCLRDMCSYQNGTTEHDPMFDHLFLAAAEYIDEFIDIGVF